MPILPYKGVWPRIAADAFIAPSATIAGDVVIASGASVWFGAVIRADSAAVRVGERSNVQDNCVIHVDEGMPCVIGAEVTLGHGAVIHGATVEDGAMVGMGATVLNGAVVGAGCIVAARALVPEGRQFAAGQLIMGVPGKVARAVTEAERQRVAEGVRHYQRYAREYHAALDQPASDRPASDRPAFDRPASDQSGK